MGSRGHLETHPARSAASSPLAKSQQLELLVETGLLLAREQNVDNIAHHALGAAMKLSGADRGTVLYTNLNEEGEAFQLQKTSIRKPEDYPVASAGNTAPGSTVSSSPVPLPGYPELLGELAPDAIRVADVAAQSIFSDTARFFGLPAGEPSVRSFLAMRIRGRHGEALGAFLLAHPTVAFFTQGVEALLATVASQAASAIENARLAQSLGTQIAISDAAQQLQQLTARRLRQALDAAALGTFTWDRQTDLLDLDDRAAELFHATPNVPIGRSLLRERLVIPEDRELTSSRLRDALESGGIYNAEYRIAAPDGSVTWLSTSGLATRSGAQVAGMTGVVQDITGRKVQEAALRQSEKLAATGRLAASIAHEINNPLEAITNLLYLVKTDLELPAHLGQMMETADSELARVGQIAQQTLGFYRDTSHPVDIDLSSLLSAVIELFARKLGYKRLQCTVDLEPDLRLFGFAGEMRQIFSNLLVNAIDATSQGTIHLRARSRNLSGHPGVVILLSDTGSGIPPHARKRIFTPFFTTKESVGTGLGLWVTRGMVEKHGGKIHFRSRTEQPAGTIFRVHLPQAFLPADGMYSAPSATLIQ